MRFSNSLLAFSLMLLSLVAQGQTPLSLPFFDDFSTATQQPSPTRWVVGSNVYINNTLTIDHPSVNIATFDGLRANGSPYSLSNVNASDTTDILTSLPINMAGLTSSDNVFLSFYWQRRGLGDRPDVDDLDSLVLECRGSDNRWLKVWPLAKPIRTDFPSLAAFDAANRAYRTDSTLYVDNRPVFKQRLVRLDRERFFHSAFQFRFRGRGRQSGAFDQWHIDYVYLNKGRTPTDTALRDLAARRTPTPLLRRYSAMPLRQFLARPTAELAETVTSDMVNVNNVFNTISYRFTVRDQSTGRVLLRRDSLDLGQRIDARAPYTMTFRQPSIPTTGLTGRVVLRTSFDVNTTDNQNPPIPGVDLRQNDTISGVTVLDDYFAYDDGSAEISTWINGRFTQTAVRFVKTLPDAVAGVRIYIPPALLDQTGQPITFSIYNDGGNVPETRRIIEETFPVKYATARDGFVEYRFKNPINVRDTFYIAYTQLSEQYIPVGFDRNSPFRNHTFVNLGTRWEAAPANFQSGALLFRPVMNGGRVDLITANEPEQPATLFPNPSGGVVNWGGALVGSVRLDVTDLSGRQWLTQPLAPTQTTTDLSHLPDGFYLLRFTNAEERTRTVKCIIRK